MKVKQIIDEDFLNYKKASMVIAFPSCSFKCDKECGQQVCQNSALATAKDIEINIDDIVNRYINNDLTSAFVFGGLEPFDSLSDLKFLIITIRVCYKIMDDIVIYTGYTPDEVPEIIKWLKRYDNIIVKFGRFIPDSKHKFDEVLGIELSSNNQFAVKL
jgi:hypothetical protein